MPITAEELLKMELKNKLVSFKQSDIGDISNGELVHGIQQFYYEYNEFKLSKNIKEGQLNKWIKLKSALDNYLISKIKDFTPLVSNISKAEKIENLIIDSIYKIIIEEMESIRSKITRSRRKVSFSLDNFENIFRTNIIFYSFVYYQAEDEEKKNKSKFEIYFDNKINRYKNRRDKFSKEGAHAFNNIRNVSNLEWEKIIKDVFSVIDTNTLVNRFEFFRDIIIYLIIKYKISFAIIEAERMKSIHNKGYLKSIKDGNTTLKRCLNIFTFTKLIAKHFPFLWATKSQHKSNINIRKPKGPLYKKYFDSYNEDFYYTSFLIEVLSFYKRSYVWSLLNDYEKAFNDYTEIEAIMEKVRHKIEQPHVHPPKLLTDYLQSYKVITLFRKGELYRRDYSFVNAFHYFCDCEEEFAKNKKGDENNDNKKKPTRLEPDIPENTGIQLLTYLSKGKTFLDMGELKRAFKWFIKSLSRACIYYEVKIDLEDEIETLDSVKSHRLIDKTEMRKIAEDILNKLRGLDVKSNNNLNCLISDIVNRLAVILYLINIPTIYKVRSWPARYIEFAIEMNNNNFLAHLNSVIFAEINSSKNMKDVVELTGCFSDGSIFERWSREYAYCVLKALDRTKQGIDRDRTTRISRKLLNKFLTYTDNLVLKNSQFYRYLMQKRTIGQIGKEGNEVRWISLRRWSSFSPFLPRPSTFAIRGGGYFLIINGFGIAIDPGEGFLDNLFSEGFSIDDIDAILVTHDHPDHLANVDGIVTLLDYKSKISHERKCIYMFLSQSATLRYSFFYKYPYVKVVPLTQNSMIDCRDYDLRLNFIIESIGTFHDDMATKGYSVGVIFHINYGNKNAKTMKIGYTSDTSLTISDENEQYWLFFANQFSINDLIDQKKDNILSNCKINEKIPVSLLIALARDDDREIRNELKKIDKNFISVAIKEKFKKIVNTIVDQTVDKFVACDMLICHISCIPFSELKSLVHINDKGLSKKFTRLSAFIKGLTKDNDREIKYIANQIGFAHWYKEDELNRMCLAKTQFRVKAQHLYLSGIIRFMERISANYGGWKQAEKNKERLFVISEFREEMGSFRNKVARYLKEEYFTNNNKINLLTADIGLHVRFKDSKMHIRCSTCANYNDYNEEDKYHSPMDIREVCVKREEEGIVYNCKRHDPTLSGEGSFFIERIEKYDVFKNRYTR